MMTSVLFHLGLTPRLPKIPASVSPTSPYTPVPYPVRHPVPPHLSLTQFLTQFLHTSFSTPVPPHLSLTPAPHTSPYTPLPRTGVRTPVHFMSPSSSRAPLPYHLPLLLPFAWPAQPSVSLSVMSFLWALWSPVLCKSLHQHLTENPLVSARYPKCPEVSTSHMCVSVYN